MGRPTDEPKERAVGVRLDAELTAFYVEKGGNISDNIREALRGYVKQNNGFVKQKNEEKDSFVKQKSSNSVKQNSQIEIPDAIYKDFLSMAKCFGMKYEDLMSDVDYLMNEGYLFIDGKRLQSMDSRLNTEAFFKKCEELGYAGKEQAVLDKLVKGMMVKK